MSPPAALLRPLMLRPLMLRSLLLCASLLTIACHKPAAPPPPTPPAAPAPEAVPGDACEVEMGGRVQELVTGNRMIAVYVAAGDCSQPGARILERAKANGDGSFFAEVWVPCGTRLSLCASVEPRVPLDGKPKPAQRWGKLERELVAQGQGEIEFFGLTWAMTGHPEAKLFSAASPLLAPPKGHVPRL